MSYLQASLQEEARIKALKQYAILDTDRDPVLDELTDLCARICDAPISLISLVDADRQWFKSKSGEMVNETLRSVSFCTHAIKSSETMVIPDALEDSRFNTNPLVVGAPNIRFYAGRALVTAEGYAIGTLCVIDRVPRQLTQLQLDSIQVLSSQVMAQMELKRKETILIESNLRLRIATENARIGLVIVSRDRTYLYANTTYTQILRLSTTEMVGKKLEEVIGDIYEQQVKPKLNRAFNGERVSYEIQISLQTPEHYYAVRYEPIFHGQIVSSVVAVISEITDRKLAEIELQKQHNELQIILDAIPTPVFYKDTNSRFIRVNAELARLFGAKPEEFIGKSDADMGSPYAEKYVANDLAVMQGRVSMGQIEEQLHTQNGTRWLLTNKVPHIDERGKVTGIIGFSVDITERKQIETVWIEAAKFSQSTIDALSAHICVVDETGRLLNTNQAWKKFLTTNSTILPNETNHWNYFTVCKNATGSEMEAAHYFLNGLQDVISGSRITFSMEYPCHTLKEKRWFLARVTRFASGDQVRAVIAHEDITSQKLSEIISQQMTSIVHASDDAIIGRDANGLITSWNRGATRIFGFESEEIVGSSGSQLLPYTRNTEEDNILSTLLSGLSVEHFETTRLTKDNRLIHVSLTASPIYTNSRQVIGESVIIRNITEKRQFELQLRASEEEFRAIFEFACIGIALCDLATGLITRANSKLCALSGYTAPELLRVQFSSLLDETDRLQFDGLSRSALTNTSIERRLDSRLKTKSGAFFWVSVTFGLLQPTSQAPGFLMIAIEDHTVRRLSEIAKRESEQLLLEIATNIQEALWLQDTVSKRMLYISPGYKRLWRREIDLLYAQPDDWLNSVASEDKERLIEALAHAKPNLNFEESFRIIMPDKTVRWIRMRTAPILSETGPGHKTIGIWEDISEQRVLEAQFRQVQKLEAVGTLAAGIAHDFNNILGAIMGNAEIALLDLATDSSTRDCLNAIMKASVRARDLVKQILTFSRKSEHHCQDVDLGAIVEEALRLIKPTTPANIQFSIHLGDSKHIIHADPTQVHQVLMNLGTNAIHAIGTRRGEISIRLSKIQLDSELTSASRPIGPGYFFTLVVEDNGCGMTPEVRDRIFEPFFTTKLPGEGTGLGLSVVHGVMERYGGAVEVMSTLAVGTSILLYFPCTSAELIDQVPHDSSLLPGDGSHVVWVDDESDLLEVGRRSLERCGYGVTAFTNPESALRFVFNNLEHCSIVITDLSMPQMSGIDFAKKLSSFAPFLPVLLTTGFASQSTLIQAKSVGICDVLTKPVSISDLSRVIRRTLTSSKHNSTRDNSEKL